MVTEMPRRVGPTAGVLVAAVLALLPSLGLPAPVSADTARIATFAGAAPRERTIVVTATDGATSTHGRFRVWRSAFGLTRSPDGAFFAVLTGRWNSMIRELAIVPTDGSAAFEIPLANRQRRFRADPSNIAWTADGRALIVGNADRSNGDGVSAVLRCSVAARSCRAVPHLKGLAAPLARGVVAATAWSSVSAWSAGLGFDDEAPLDSDTLRRIRRPQRTRTVLSTTTLPASGSLRTVRQRRANLLDGVDGTVAIVGGPLGALVAYSRDRVRLRHTKHGIFGRSVASPLRWALVTPGGRARTVTAPQLTVPKAHSAPIGDNDYFLGKIEAQRALPRPRAPIAHGGWLAVTGSPTAVGGDDGLVLTAITPSGHASFVRIGGRIGSATELVRTALGRPPTPGTPSLEIVGYETATNAAVVSLSWGEGARPKVDTLPDGTIDPEGVIETSEEDSVVHLATVRVPLDGRTAPTVINREREQAAW